ncbi:MAG: hypothetical protein A3B66_08460 [Alphaproteobacteria bacterium RIFCSPHIGHO2_02_FULL_46_13]|nr:MAG: hypothetical protein A3B66_08460 [Alphaproteobacteria bacterium RIFCSPHIGHO2_02_FULL_46_13]
MRKCAAKGPFGTAAVAKAPAPTPLDKYVTGSHVGKMVKSFVETMRGWQATLVDVHTLAKKLPDEINTNLGLFTQCVSHSLPTFCSLCEGVSRHNRHAYDELSDLIGLSVRIHAYGILRQREDKIGMMRYGHALNVVTELLKCAEPRHSNISLPPLHVDEGTHLAHALSNSMSDICLILFRQMREDKLGDQVDFILERTTHILAEDTRYTEDARRGMQAAFEAVYKQMTAEEKKALAASRFYTRCDTSRATICNIIRDIDLAEFRGRKCHSFAGQGYNRNLGGT